jgi:hypothetical protein
MNVIKILVPIWLVLVIPQTIFAQKTVRFDLPAFTEISLKIDAKLILKQDSIQEVTVKASEETIRKMVVEVSDRKLIVKYSNDAWFDSKWTQGEVLVTVSTPQIDALTQYGSGSIVAEQPISSRILDLHLGGSGSIKLNKLKADRISAVLSGSGHLFLAGNGLVSDFKMAVSGSGGVNATELKAKTVNVILSGSGNCAVHSLEKLSCKILGSGSVTYLGNPAIESTILGSGTVKEGK